MTVIERIRNVANRCEGKVKKLNEMKIEPNLYFNLMPV